MKLRGGRHMSMKRNEAPDQGTRVFIQLASCERDYYAAISLNHRVRFIFVHRNTIPHVLREGLNVKQTQTLGGIQRNACNRKSRWALMLGTKR